jgi:hypothetical protein
MERRSAPQQRLCRPLTPHPPSQERKRYRLHRDVPLLRPSNDDALHAQLAMLQRDSLAQSNWGEQRKSIMAQPIFAGGAGSSGAGAAAAAAAAVAGGGGGGSSRALVPVASSRGAGAAAAAAEAAAAGASRKKQGAAQGLSAAGQKLFANKLQALAKQQKSARHSLLGKRSHQSA